MSLFPSFPLSSLKGRQEDSKHKPGKENLWDCSTTKSLLCLMQNSFSIGRTVQQFLYCTTFPMSPNDIPLAI